MSEEAFARCQGIIPLVDAQKQPVNIIGCGATGSYTALALAKMGFSVFYLYDDDTVEEANIGPQLYGSEHIGKPKVEALKELLTKLSPAIAITTYNERVNSQSQLEKAITIVALDSMEGRKTIWTHFRKKLPFIVDPRIGGQIIRVFTIPFNSPDHYAHYKESLYSDEEAYELPCAERGVADVSLIVGGFVSGLVRKFITKGTSIKEYYLDVLNMETYKVEQKGTG